MKFLYVDECLSCLEYFNYQNHMRLLNSFEMLSYLVLLLTFRIEDQEHDEKVARCSA